MQRPAARARRCSLVSANACTACDSFAYTFDAGLYVVCGQQSASNVKKTFRAYRELKLRPLCLPYSNQNTAAATRHVRHRKWKRPAPLRENTVSQRAHQPVSVSVSACPSQLATAACRLHLHFDHRTPSLRSDLGTRINQQPRVLVASNKRAVYGGWLPTYCECLSALSFLVCLSVLLASLVFCPVFSRKMC